MMKKKRIVCFVSIATCLLHANASLKTTTTLLFNEVCVANIDQTIDFSNNYGSWVEIYNPTALPISLSEWYISDDADALRKYNLSEYGTINSNEYLCVFFGHNAADGEYGKNATKQVPFKLNKEGGTLYLSHNGNEIHQSVTYPQSIARCSYAKKSFYKEEWAYCGLPTPGAQNDGNFAEECLDMPQVDCNSTLFTSPFSVHVSIPDGAILRYTTNGSTPTLKNGQTSRDGNFYISRSTVLRLRLFADGFLPSGVLTRTYLYKDKDYYLPIVAISTDPLNLYDNYIGCYVRGKNGITGRGSDVPSNLNMDWERPVNFEYITSDGNMVINQETSFEVAGGYSRHFEPASFKLQAKKSFDGKSSFKFPLFKNKPYCNYKQLLIRNGGNNNRTWGGPRIQDAITQQILTTSGYYVDAQEYQPAHVFINGKYVAMMNVREPNNHYHGCANYGYDNDEIDGFEYSDSCYHQKVGNNEAFYKMIALSENAGTDSGYEELSKLLDIEEFTRYMAAICYTGSYDWVLNGNNVKGYRSWKDGKFHFVFFDQDLTWQRTNNVEVIDGVKINEVLVLYNNLKRNETFRKQFVTSYCLLHNCIYAPERCKHIADSICNLVKNALSFDRRYTTVTYENLEHDMWGEEFRKNRLESLKKAYNLDDGYHVTILSDNCYGHVQIEGQDVPFNKYEGTLWGKNRVHAASADGYKFIGWADNDSVIISYDKNLEIQKGGTYIATYSREMNQEVSPVCINEISASNEIFINDYRKREDWIELYNRGNEAIDVKDWYFSDDAKFPLKYQINAAPNVCTTIQPNDYLVIWCDEKESISQPHLPFKLKNADNATIHIQSEDGKWNDSIRYIKHKSKETIGRYPDGGNSCQKFYCVTIGKRNVTSQYDVVLSSTPDSVLLPSEENEIVSISYYSVDGIKILHPFNGVFIKTVLYKNGSTHTSKILIRNGIQKEL